MLISPFVGHIYDWHKKSSGKDFTADEDPGVRSIQTSTATTSRTAMSQFEIYPVGDGASSRRLQSWKTERVSCFHAEVPWGRLQPGYISQLFGSVATCDRGR